MISMGITPVQRSTRIGEGLWAVISLTLRASRTAPYNIHVAVLKVKNLRIKVWSMVMKYKSEQYYLNVRNGDKY